MLHQNEVSARALFRQIDWFSAGNRRSSLDESPEGCWLVRAWARSASLLRTVQYLTVKINVAPASDSSLTGRAWVIPVSPSCALVALPQTRKFYGNTDNAALHSTRFTGPEPRPHAGRLPRPMPASPDKTGFVCSFSSVLKSHGGSITRAPLDLLTRSVDLVPSN